MGSRELDKAVADGSVKAWQITRQQAVEHIARTTKGTPTHLGGPVSQETVERAHRLSVAQAFSEGKPVPPEVLADYPELQQKGPASAQTVLETEGEVRPVAGGEDVRRGGEVEGGAVAAREGAAAQVGRHPNITHNTGAERLYNNLVDRVGVQQANKLVDNAVATYKDLTAGKIKAHKGDVGISQTRLARAIVDEYGLDPSRVRAISKSLQVPKEVPYAKGQTQQREGQDVPLQQQGQGGGEARATAAEEDVAPPSREVGSDAPASAQVEAERPSLVDGYEVDEFRIPKRAIKSEGAPLGFLTKSDADSYLSKSKKAARKNWEAVHSGSRWWIVPRSAKQESPDPATLSYAALRQRAKDLGLSPVGSKAVLVERVRGATGQGQTVPPEPTGPRIESPRPVSPSPTTPTEQIPSAQSTASEPRTPVSAPSEPPGKGRPAPAPESAGKAKEATEREDVETPQSREAQLQNAVKSYRDGETVPLQEWLQDHSAEYQRKSDRIAKLESSGDSKNRSEIDSLIADLEAIELDVVERFSPPGELQPPPPQGTMIPRKGKGRAGGVAGLDRVAHEIAALTIRAAGRVRSSVSGAATGARYYFQRGTTFIQRYGDAGRKIARDLRTIAFESHRKAQSDLQDIRELLKGVSRENVEKVMKAADGKTEGLPKWIEERGERVRAILGRVMSNFAEVGGLRTVAGNKVVPHGSGKAFPQVANAEGKRTLDELAEMGEKSSRVMAAAEYMVEQGQAESITDAIAMLHRFRERQLRGINPYLEKERVELPPNLREWNPDKVLPHTLDRGWKLVEAIRIWGWDDLGKSFPHAVELIETIRSEAAAPHAYDAARDIEAFIKAEFGAGDEAPSWQQAISQSVNAWQTVSKLGLSPLSTVKNGLDRYAKGLTVATIPSNFKATLMYPPIISTWLRSARQIEDQVLRRGAIFSTTTLSEGVEKGGAITHLVMAPFRAAETGNQVYLALVKSIQVQKDLAALADIDKSGKVKNFLRKWMSLGQYGEAAIKDRLTRMGVVDISDINVEGIVQRAIAERKGLTEDELAGVMHRATRDLAFPVMLSTKRIWWDNAPFVRVLAKFKTWGVDQIGHIHADVYRQVLKGNYAPAGRFLLAMVFAGELYNLLRDLLFGDDESLTMSIAKRPDRMNAKGIAKRIAADFFDGGGVGIIADLTYGLVDFIGGPTAGTAKTLMKETLPDIARRPSQAPTAIREFFRSEIAASRQADAVINAVDRKVGNRLNRSREYYRWRKRAFEWMDESGKRTEGETDFITRGLFGIAEVFEGRQTFDRTSRSLAYEMAARQITVGDVEDAANYLRIVLKDAKNDDDRASILSGMKGSMRSRSPLGRVAQKDRDKFLSKFSPQDRAEAIRVQDEWIADYEKAIRLAQSEP